MASCDLQDTFNAPSAVTSWPDVNAPQMEINRALLNNDFLPSAPNSPPNTGSTELFPEDPYQHIKDLDHQVLTTGYLTVVPHVIIHPFSATFVMLKPATSLSLLLMEPPRSQHSKEPLTATSPLMKDKSLSLA
ncbi:hypothetical protein MHU86_14830 [Fragilaria crotonensis]|nr:hypothetical protein MHU86_14830 [Fragilaria crotonensis]